MQCNALRLINAMWTEAEIAGDLPRAHLISGAEIIDLENVPILPALNLESVGEQYIQSLHQLEFLPGERNVVTTKLARFLFALGVDERAYGQLFDFLAECVQDTQTQYLTFAWLDLLNWVFDPKTMNGSQVDLRRRDILLDYPRRLGAWSVFYNLFIPDFDFQHEPHNTATPLERLLTLGYSVKELDEIKYREANTAMLLIPQVSFIDIAAFNGDTSDIPISSFELFELYLWHGIRMGRSHWKDALNMRFSEGPFEREWKRLRRQLRAKQK